jgi:hypothetical protein
MPEISVGKINLLLAGQGVTTLSSELGDGASTFQDFDDLTKTVNRVPPGELEPGHADKQAASLRARRMRASYGGNLSGNDRFGFVITSDQWRTEAGGGRAIALHAGPNEVQWSLPLRAQEEENKAGHARYAQARHVAGSGGRSTQASQTFFDFPRADFQFQTGNIMPIPSALGLEQLVPYGLEDFYLFMELLNQPPLIATGPDEGKHNYIWIFYTSLQLPQVVMKGYFDPQGISWSDSSESASAFTWSASFTVHEMTPNLWDRSELVDAYEIFMKDNVKMF